MRTPDKWMHARKPFAYIPRAGLAGRLAALWIQLWGISSKRNIEQLLSKCLFPSRISSEHQQVHLIFLNILRGMLKSIPSQWQKAAFRIFWEVPKKAPGKTSFDFVVLWLIWVCSIQNPFPLTFKIVPLSTSVNGKEGASKGRWGLAKSPAPYQRWLREMRGCAWWRVWGARCRQNRMTTLCPSKIIS